MQRSGVDKLQTALMTAFQNGEPDLSLRQLAILMSISKHGQISIGELSAQLHIPKPAVTRAVDRLEQLDLCKREFSACDRRKVLAVSKRNAHILLETWEERLSC